MYLDNSLLINQQKLQGIEKDITCPICQGIINDPYFCSKCQNNFCNNCISKWKMNNSKCPYRCKEPEYINNRYLKKIFNELLKFKCEKGCEEVISYKDVNTHYENCKNEDYKEKYYESATQVEILKIQIENYKDIENDLDQARERNNELENEIEEINESKNNLENELEEIIEKKKDLENDIEDLQDENYGFRREIKDLKKENTDLENDLNKEKEKSNNMEKQVEILQKEVKELETKLVYANEKIKELEYINMNLKNGNNTHI